MAIAKCKECGAEVSTKAKQCPKCGAPVKKRTSIVTWLVAILLGVWVVGYFASGPSTDRAVPSSSKKEPTPREVAMKNTKLDFSWGKTGFGNVMEATFTVQNKSNYNIKDIAIKCIHEAKSGTTIDTNTKVIYDIVKANSTRRFEKVNMGFIHSQAHSSSCYISDLVVG